MWEYIFFIYENTIFIRLDSRHRHRHRHTHTHTHTFYL